MAAVIPLIAGICAPGCSAGAAAAAAGMGVAAGSLALPLTAVAAAGMGIFAYVNSNNEKNGEEKKEELEDDVKKMDAAGQYNDFGDCESGSEDDQPEPELESESIKKSRVVQLHNEQHKIVEPCVDKRQAYQSFF